MAATNSRVSDTSRHDEFRKAPNQLTLPFRNTQLLPLQTVSPTRSPIFEAWKSERRKSQVGANFVRSRA